MKLNITLLISILFFSCSNKEKGECNYIDNYYPYTAKAEIEFYLGNYQKAFDFYQKAFKSCEALNITTHNDTGKFAKVCVELGKVDLALEYIEKRIKNGGLLQEFTRDSVFNQVFNTKRGKEIIAAYEKMKEEFLNSINFELRKELQNMIWLDQKFNSTKFQDSMFAVNDKRLVEIFEEFGYPNEQVIGSYNIDYTQSDPTILLLHSHDSIRIKYFIPKLRECVKNGTCPPSTLGVVLDNLELFNDRPQTHGTYKGGGDGGYATMISDRKKVDKNRQSIGLPTLEMQEKIERFILNDTTSQ